MVKIDHTKAFHGSWVKVAEILGPACFIWKSITQRYRINYNQTFSLVEQVASDIWKISGLQETCKVYTSHKSVRKQLVPDYDMWYKMWYMEKPAADRQTGAVIHNMSTVTYSAKPVSVFPVSPNPGPGSGMSHKLQFR